MDWESFKQDIVNQRVYSWLIEMGKNEEAKRVYSIHSDWGTQFPHLSTLLLFDILRCEGQANADSYINELKRAKQKEIETEYEEFHTQNMEVDRLLGHDHNEMGRTILGFLLLKEGGVQSVYPIYEGDNTYGAARIHNDDCHQMMVAIETQLGSKHFFIHAERKKSILFKVLSGNVPFLLNCTEVLSDGAIDWGSTLVLGGLEITILENFNK